MRSQKKSVVLACFSPPVMVATFITEIILAIYTVVRYKLGARGRAIVGLLVCLAAFQLAEYFVCTDSTVAIGSARAGYVAITFLPVLGLYLMALLTVRLSRAVLWLMFVSTAVFALYFLIARNAFDSYQCTGNYVIFQIGLWQSRAYGVFYFGFILAAIARGLNFLRKSPRAKTVEAVRWFIVGYVVFIVPVAVLTVLHPDTRDAVPSILCGFAVTMAIILAVFVAPLVLKRRSIN